jgi:hypothetical protein
VLSVKPAKVLVAILTALALVALGQSVLPAQPAPYQPPGAPGPSQQQMPGQAPAPAPEPGQTPVAPAQPAPVVPPAAAPATTTIEGVVADAQPTWCGVPVSAPAGAAAGSAPAGACEAVLQITPGVTEIVRTQRDAEALYSKANAIQVTVMPGATVQWNGAAIPAEDLRAGDQVRVTYYTVHDANIATSVAVLGRMGGPTGP